jgi:serine protease SohB
VIDLLFQYLLFAAKAITLLVSVIVVIGFIANTVTSKTKETHFLTVVNINEKLEELTETLETAILDKRELKALDKKRKKEEKKKKKEHDPEHEAKHLFLLKFDGDLEASETDNLRECITAILGFASPDDEVLVTIDSGGGIVHNYGLAASQLQRIKDAGLKLTVSVDLVAASGGYMMACVADKIIAAPFAVLGSIGVVAQIPNFNKLLSKHDVEIEHHTAGAFKTTLTMLGKNTAHGREKFQEELEEIHVLFKDHVSKSRPQLDIEKVATGEAWYGHQCLDLHLVDKIQTSDDYLLQHKDTHKMYELFIEQNESIKDKISTLLSKETLFKLVQNMWLKLYQTPKAGAH